MDPNAQWLDELEDVEPMDVGICNCEDIAQAVAELHLRPDQPIPSDWETCPICQGEGCGDCDRCGKVHPTRHEWFEDAIVQDCASVEDIEAWLKDNRIPHQAWRTHAWWAAQAELANELLANWRSEDRRRLEAGRGPDAAIPD